MRSRAEFSSRTQERFPAGGPPGSACRGESLSGVDHLEVRVGGVIFSLLVALKFACW